MKKVLALSLVLALFAVSANAQDQKTERLRRQRIEQKMEHRGQQFRNPAVMKHRQQVMKHRLMKQRMIRQHRAVPQRRAMMQKRMQMQQHRRMMLRRHLMHRRVI